MKRYEQLAIVGKWDVEIYIISLIIKTLPRSGTIVIGDP